MCERICTGTSPGSFWSESTIEQRSNDSCKCCENVNTRNNYVNKKISSRVVRPDGNKIFAEIFLIVILILIKIAK